MLGGDLGDLGPDSGLDPLAVAGHRWTLEWTKLYFTVLYSTVLYCTVLYSTGLDNTLLY